MGCCGVVGSVWCGRVGLVGCAALFAWCVVS